MWVNVQVIVVVVLSVLLEVSFVFADKMTVLVAPGLSNAFNRLSSSPVFVLLLEHSVVLGAHSDAIFVVHLT